MADLKCFVILVMVLVAKEGAFSCSLRSHKHGSSHPCLPSTSDSTSDSQLTPVLNTISSPSNSDSSSSTSSSLSSVHGNGSVISSTPTISPDMSSQGSISFIPPTPSVPTDNMNILNSLIQLLSSPAFSTLHASKTQTPNKSVLSSTSTSNASQSSASLSKPHSTSLPCAPGSASSSYSSILPASPPCGSIPSILNTIQIPKLLHSVSTPSSGISPDLTNSLIKISSLIPTAPYLSTSKPTPPCPLLTQTLNKNVVPGKKPCAISHPVGPSLSVLPGVLHGSPSSSNLSVQIPVSEKLPVPVPEHGPEIAPEEFPASSNVPVSIPIVTSTSTPTSFSNINPAFIDFLRKLLVASQAKTGLSFPPIPTKTHVIPTFNTAPVSAPDTKPHTTSPACGTSSESPNSCSSSILHNQSIESISRLKQILMSMTAPPVSGISFGYNPEFMKLLINNLLSNQTSSLPSLSSLYSLLQAKLNITPIVPLAPNPIPASTTYRPLSELNPNVFNTSSNNTFDSAPAGSYTNQNTSISNDQYLTNILINLLTSSNATKTSFLPCLSSTNSDSISTLNTTPVSSVPCIPPFSSLPDILSKFPNLSPSTNPSFPGLIPSPIIPSLPNIKPFSERVQHLNPVPTLTPTSYPLLPKLDINLCRSKHKGSLQLSSSTSTAVDPCLQNAIRSHTPHLPLPCSLSHTKLSSGCKHVLPAI